MAVFLWGVAFTLVILVVGIFFYKAKETETHNEKVILYGFGFFSFTGAFIIVFMLLSLPELWYNTFLLRFLLFILLFELTVKHTKYLLTIVFITLVVIFNVLYFNTLYVYALLLLNIIFLYSIIVIVLIVVKYAKLSQAEFKGVSMFFLLGMALITLGSLLFTYSYINNIILLITVPILYIIAHILWIVPTVINPKYFSRSLQYCRVIGLFIIILWCFVDVFLILYGVPIVGIIIMMVFTILFLYTYYTLVKIIKSKKDLKNGEETLNIFGAFTKPQKATEEEVTISKEKKICLVCKGKTSRLTYICPKCDAIYCVKCSNTMSDLENACWACETPFDESKPVKPYKKEEEKVEVEEKIQKTSNN